MQEIVDDEKSVATCILCGELLQGLEVVKYRDWNVHAECAKQALEQQVDSFDRIPFYIGSLGSVFGILLSVPILSISYPIMDPTTYWVALIGMGIGLLFQVFGFYGFASTYDEGIGVICSIIAVVTAICHVFGGALLLQFGYDSVYYDPETGALLFEAMPFMQFILPLSFGFLLLLMVLIGVMILLLGESVTFGFDNRIIAVIFIGAAALMPLIPFNFFIEMVLVTILFMTAQVPKEWTEVKVD